MTWTQIAYATVSCGAILWWMWRTRREFRRGYLLALDHIEQMTKPRKLSKPCSLPDALALLRSESGATPQSE